MWRRLRERAEWKVFAVLPRVDERWGAVDRQTMAAVEDRLCILLRLSQNLAPEAGTWPQEHGRKPLGCALDGTTNVAPRPQCRVC